MKALSIREPWAWLICAGYQDVENRSWHLHMPPLLNHPSYAKNVPMRIYVHAGKRFDKAGLGGVFPLGAIIGEVDIVGCKFRDPDENANLYSPWHVPGQYGFLLKNPVLYAHPIPCKGRLGFFEVPAEIQKGVNHAVS